MVLNETIRQCLHECSATKDAAALQHAYATLQHAVHARLPGDRPQGDLYIDFAEVAIKVCIQPHSSVSALACVLVRPACSMLTHWLQGPMPSAMYAVYRFPMRT
jgi:hypothetical protein